MTDRPKMHSYRCICGKSEGEHVCNPGPSPFQRKSYGDSIADSIAVESSGAKTYEDDKGVGHTKYTPEQLMSATIAGIRVHDELAQRRYYNQHDPILKDIEMFVVLRTGPTWQSIGSAIFDSYKDALDYAGLLDKAEVYRLVKPTLLNQITFVRYGHELIEVKKFSDIDTNKVSVQFNNAIEQAKVKGCGVTVEMERPFIWDVAEDEDQPAGYVVYLEAPRD